MRYVLIPILALSLVSARAPKRLKEPAQAFNSITTFQTNSTHPVVAGSSSFSNTTHIWSGAQSNTLTVGSASMNVFYQTLPAQKNICADSFFRVSFRFTNKANIMNLNSLTLYVANNGTNLISYEAGSFSIRDTGETYPGEWQHLYLMRKQFTTIGTYNCATVDTIAIGFRAQTGTFDTITLGEVASYPGRYGKATMIIHEDDQWLSWLTDGVPKLDSLGYKHTIYVNTGRLGVVNFSNFSQLDSLRNRGLCDFGSHLYQHDTATAIPLDSLKVSLTRNRDFMIAAGWDSPRRFAYPFGLHNLRIDSAMRAWDMVDFARLTNSSIGEPSVIGNNPFSQRTYVSLGNTVSLADGTALVDSLVSRRAVGIFLFHQIGPVGCTEDGNTWCKDKFLAFMNHVKTKVDAGTLQVLSQGQYEEKYGGGFSPSRRNGTGGR